MIFRGTDEDIRRQLTVEHQLRVKSDREVKRLRKDLTVSKLTFSKQQQMMSEISKLKSEKCRIEMNYNTLQRNHKQLEESYNSLQTNFKQLEENYKSLERNCRSAFDQMSTLRQQTAFLESKNQNLESELVKMRDENYRLRRDLSIAKDSEFFGPLAHDAIPFNQSVGDPFTNLNLGADFRIPDITNSPMSNNMRMLNSRSALTYNRSPSRIPENPSHQSIPSWNPPILDFENLPLNGGTEFDNRQLAICNRAHSMPSPSSQPPIIPIMTANDSNDCDEMPCLQPEPPECSQALMRISQEEDDDSSDSDDIPFRCPDANNTGKRRKKQRRTHSLVDQWIAKHNERRLANDNTVTSGKRGPRKAKEPAPKRTRATSRGTTKEPSHKSKPTQTTTKKTPAKRGPKKYKKNTAPPIIPIEGGRLVYVGPSQTDSQQSQGSQETISKARKPRGKAKENPKVNPKENPKGKPRGRPKAKTSRMVSVEPSQVTDSQSQESQESTKAKKPKGKPRGRPKVNTNERKTRKKKNG